MPIISVDDQHNAHTGLRRRRVTWAFSVRVVCEGRGSAGVLAFEIGVVRSSMDREDILRVARVDIWYGVLAGAIILVGFSRAIFAAKGWAYYSVNLFFWAKLGAFAVVGLLSIMPTVEFIRWRKAASSNLAFSPAPLGIRNVRRVLFAEAILFALIPAFAAAMARGYGSLSH